MSNVPSWVETVFVNQTDRRARPLWALFANIAGFLFTGAICFGLMKALHLKPSHTDLGDPSFIPDSFLGRFFPPLGGLMIAALALRLSLLRSYFPARGWAGRLGLGFGLGVLFISLCVGAEALSGHEHLGLTGEGATAVLTAALVQLLIFLPQSMGEEIVFRGVLMQQLARAVGGWVRWGLQRAAPAVNAEAIGRGVGQSLSVIFLGAMFGLMHKGNPGSTLASSLNIALVGWWFGVLVFKCRGSLWIAGGVHAGWNWAQGFLWGEPVSGLATGHSLIVRNSWTSETWTGGAFGPEASYVCSALFVALLVATLLWKGVPAREGDALSSRPPPPEPTPELPAATGDLPPAAAVTPSLSVVPNPEAP